MRIDLVLTDDWELRGDGSGDMRIMQFAQLRRLLEIYERHDLKASLYAEVMQQLTHLSFGARHSALGRLAREWEEIVQETLERGHDVQLHVHPQWSGATYKDGHWALPGSWSLLDYSADTVSDMVREAKSYLETVAKPARPAYRCVSFRSSAWAVAPSDQMLPILVKQGFTFDSSISEGIFFNTMKVHVDYRSIDEPFLPFYPQLDDARRVAQSPQPIVCVPTYSFRSRLSSEALARLVRGLARERPPSSSSRIFEYCRPCDTRIPDKSVRRTHTSEFWRETRFRDQWRRAVRLFYSPRTADLCTLNVKQMHEMLGSIRRRAVATSFTRVPVILANHTKSIGNFAPIEAFANEVAQSPDLEVITLSKLASNLRQGVYPIRMDRCNAVTGCESTPS
jgi:hypothetical protein